MAKISEKLWFILGSFPEISAAEIAAVLNLTPAEMDMNAPLLFVSKTAESPEKLIDRLGGTIKIAAEIGEADTDDELVACLTKHLINYPGKITFGISYYGESYKTLETGKLKNWGKTIKEILRQNGRGSRYIFKNEPTLSSATVEHNGLLKKGAEFIVTRLNEKYLLARTIAVQPFEEWGKRDFGRPSRDDLSGMLPPKIARIMINLAPADPAKSVLLDPFCGSGTIIAEASLVGFKKIIGADISAKAVADTKNNLKWLASRRHISLENIEIKQLDARELSKNIRMADAIVTEPYLGPPQRGRENLAGLRTISRELKQLYLSSLDEFSKILSPAGNIIMVIPRFKYGNDWIRVELADEFKKIGLIAVPLLKTKSREYGFLFYARENQRVGREIWRFRKISS